MQRDLRQQCRCGELDWCCGSDEGNRTDVYRQQKLAPNYRGSFQGDVTGHHVNGQQAEVSADFAVENVFAVIFVRQICR